MLKCIIKLIAQILKAKSIAEIAKRDPTLFAHGDFVDKKGGATGAV
jgi:hypothetical protein